MIQQEIRVKVSFAKHTLTKKDSGVVEGDYNTTKLIFEFEEDVSGHRVVFKMSNPSGDLALIKNLEDNEITLVGYDDEGNVCSLFADAGLYPFELVLYGEDSKLTSAPGWVNVTPRQVTVRTDDGTVSPDLDDVYATGFNDGKKAEHDAFWDDYQDGGNRENYNNAFQQLGWNDSTFWPKYSICPALCNNIFNECRVSNIKQRLLDCGVTFDTSQATTGESLFTSAITTEIPAVSYENITNLKYTFYGARYCVTIDKLILRADGTNTFQSTFASCASLENIVIEGTIGQNGFNISHSPKLTHDSLMSIINALADYSADESGTAWKVTIGATNLEKLTDEELTIARNKGWQVV